MSKGELHNSEVSKLESMHKDWGEIIDAIRDPIFMHDKEFRIIRANRAYASKAGMDTPQIIGKPYWQVFPRQDGPLPRAHEAMQSPTPEESRQKYQLANGEVYNIRSFVMTDERNNYLYSVHIMEELKDTAPIECSSIREKLHTTFSNTVQAIATAAEARDPYTAGHQRRVADFATVIGKELGLSGHQLEGIHLASLVHDIGKLHVPTELLTKPRQLEHAEYELVKSHAGVGNMILSSIDFPWPIAEMVHQHHERLDGSGYPNGLKGDGILLEAQVIGIADVIEAIVAHRPYHPARDISVAIKEITMHRGSKFHSDLVDTCLHLLQEQHYEFTPGQPG